MDLLVIGLMLLTILSSGFSVFVGIATVLRHRKIAQEYDKLQRSVRRHTVRRGVERAELEAAYAEFMKLLQDTLSE